MARVEGKGLIRNRRSMSCRPRRTSHGIENSASGLNIRWKMRLAARFAVLRKTSFESRLGYCLDAELGSFLD